MSNIFIKGSKRNGEIELWRFIMAVVIVCFHSIFLFPQPLFAAAGLIGVEFFFLLSGYLLAATATKHRKANREQTWDDINHDSYSLLFRRVSQVFPECLISSLIAVLVYFCARGSLSVSFFTGTVLPTIFSNAFMLKMTGLFPFFSGVHGVTWYLSTLLLSTALLYPLLRCRGVNPFLGVVGVLSLGGLYIAVPNANCIGQTGGVNMFVYCNIRGFSEMLLGASLYPIVQWLRTAEPTKAALILFTLVKWVCGLAVVLYAEFYYKLGHHVGIIIFLMCVLIVLMFYEKCLDHQWYQNKVCISLGKFSLPLFLSNAFYAHVLGGALTDRCGTVETLCIYFAASCLTALVVMFLSQQLRALPPLLVFEKKK